MTLESKLMDALKSRDKNKLERVFEKIYDSYHGLIYFCIAQYVHLDEDVEEILNDVFIKFFNHLNDFEIKSIKYYLVQSARNASIDFIRKRNRRKEVEFDETILIQEGQKIEDKNLYYDIKNYLDENDFKILEEYIVIGKSSSEIALELNTTPGAVRTKISRIKKILKKKFGGKMS